MMPQLGVLSVVHPKAAIEVFEKDCLIRLGTCIAPVGEQKKEGVVLSYKIDYGDSVEEGELLSGEMRLLKIPYEKAKATLIPGKGLDGGAGIDEHMELDITGGVVGVVLDGRGRKPFNLPKSSDVRINSLLKWSDEIDEYPKGETSNV